MCGGSGKDDRLCDEIAEGPSLYALCSKIFPGASGITFQKLDPNNPIISEDAIRFK